MNIFPILFSLLTSFSEDILIFTFLIFLHPPPSAPITDNVADRSSQSLLLQKLHRQFAEIIYSMIGFPISFCRNVLKRLSPSLQHIIKNSICTGQIGLLNQTMDFLFILLPFNLVKHQHKSRNPKCGNTSIDLDIVRTTSFRHSSHHFTIVLSSQLISSSISLCIVPSLL